MTPAPSHRQAELALGRTCKQEMHTHVLGGILYRHQSRWWWQTPLKKQRGGRYPRWGRPGAALLERSWQINLVRGRRQANTRLRLPAQRGNSLPSVKVLFASGHFCRSPGQRGSMYYGSRQCRALDNKKHRGGRKKKTSVPFIFIIMFIEFGSKGADIKGWRRDS